MHFLRAKILILFSSLLLFSSLSVFAQTIRVTILHVNDVYQFMPVEGGKRGGLARLQTLRKEALKENPNVIFTLGGDTLSPSVETRTYRGAQMIDAWNAISSRSETAGHPPFALSAPPTVAGSPLTSSKASDSTRFPALRMRVKTTVSGKLGNSRFTASVP